MSTISGQFQIMVAGKSEPFVIDSAWLERRWRVSYRFFYLIKEVDYLDDYILVFSLKDSTWRMDPALEFRLQSGQYCGIQNSGIGNPFVYNADLGGSEIRDTVRVTAYHEKKPIGELVFAAME